MSSLRPNPTCPSPGRLTERHTHAHPHHTLITPPLRTHTPTLRPAAPAQHQVHLRQLNTPLHTLVSPPRTPTLRPAAPVQHQVHLRHLPLRLKQLAQVGLGRGVGEVSHKQPARVSDALLAARLHGLHPTATAPWVPLALQLLLLLPLGPILPLFPALIFLLCILLSLPPWLTAILAAAIRLHGLLPLLLLLA